MGIVGFHIVASYLLLSMGTYCLWIAETVASPYAMVVALLSLLAAVFTDWKKWILLPSWLLSVIGTVLFFATFASVLFAPSNVLLSLGHFCAQLQCLLIFREKKDRDWGLLYLLNLLQVLIGSVHNTDSGAGMLALGYSLASVVTQILFLLRRECGNSGDRLVPFRLDAISLISVSMSVASLPIALLLFWSLPRAGAVYMPPVSVAAGSLQTGFSDTVSLDEFSNVLESDEIVFSVWAKDHQGKPVNLPADSLWRGMVFTSYREKKWVQSPSFLNQIHQEWPVSPGRLQAGEIDLTVELRLRVGSTLFCPKQSRWVGLNRRPGLIQFYPTEERVALSEGWSAASTPRSQVNYRIVAQKSGLTTTAPGPCPAHYRMHALELPPRLTRLKQFAQQLTAGLADDNVDGKIQRILGRLNQGDYVYTLDLPPTEGDADPVEDFLFRTKAGHCEYFASSLALMLRAVGVPTRVVNGFKGVDYNPAGGYYQVRQLLAHSWVEAYRPGDPAGQWLTLDPSPPEARAGEIARNRSAFQPVKELADASNRVWVNYFLAYNNEQQANLFAAVTAWTRFVIERMMERMREFGWRLMTLLENPGAFFDPESWPTLLVLFAAVGFLVGYRSPRVRSFWVWIKERLGRRPHAFPLFNHLQLSMARAGLKRKEAQTPREYVQDLAKWLGQQPNLSQFQLLPDHIVDLYYEHQFAERRPSEADVAKLREQLKQMVALLPNRIVG